MESNKIFKSDIKAKYLEPRPGDVKHSLADISKARKLLGYNPISDFHDGLRNTVEWYKKAGKTK